MNKESIKKEIIKEIEENKNEEVEFLQKLVQTPSANPFVANPLMASPYEPVEKEVAKLIFKRLSDIGLSPEFVGMSENRPNVVAELGQGEKTLIFNGHMDTVVPSPQYSFDPYSGLIKKK
jgi:acetylornithine deacetylase/succinyl-diaminopimelate desuccinylase-like protein